MIANTTVKIANIQSLRFLFVMMIVLSHLWKGFDYGGECGVAFFFVISGYVMSLAHGEAIENGTFSTGLLLVRQLKKFYPLHLLTALFFLILSLLKGAHLNAWMVVLNLSLLQSWTMDMDIYFSLNATSWFLSTIFFCYLMFGLMYRFVMSMHKTYIVWVVCVLYLFFAMLVVPESRINDVLYVFPPLRLLDFTLGILLYRRLKRKSLESDCGQELVRRRCVAVQITAMLLIVVFFIVYLFTPKRLSCAALFWILSFFVLYIMIKTDVYDTWLNRMLHSRLLLYLGGLSMEIFQTHLCVKELLDLCRSRCSDVPFSDLLLGLQIPAIIVTAMFVQWGTKKIEGFLLLNTKWLRR